MNGPAAWLATPAVVLVTALWLATFLRLRALRRDSAEAAGPLLAVCLGSFAANVALLAATLPGPGFLAVVPLHVAPPLCLLLLLHGGWGFRLALLILYAPFALIAFLLASMAVVRILVPDQPGLGPTGPAGLLSAVVSVGYGTSWLLLAHSASLKRRLESLTSHRG